MTREERAKRETLLELKRVLEFGFFDPAASAERAAEWAAWPIIRHVERTWDATSEGIETMQRQLAFEARNDAVKHRAALIVADFFLREGLALEPSLGRVISETLSGSNRPRRNKSQDQNAMRDRIICFAVNRLWTGVDHYTGEPWGFSQLEAAEIVAFALREIGKGPTNPDTVYRIFLSVRRARAADTVAG